VETDYLIVGSGLSALVFGSLMAKAGQKVRVLEAHEYPGGFGHTFTMAKKYKFNAQLHYVWDCGEGDTVNRVLKKLELVGEASRLANREVTFERYDPDGFDRMHMPDYTLAIPASADELKRRLVELFPASANQINKFIDEVQSISNSLKILSPPINYARLFQQLGAVAKTLTYLNSTLQQAFDRFNLPPAAQTLLALQWPDFLLPPDKLSFYAWVILFTGYQKGAFYPTQHFERVINALVNTIEANGGEVLLDREVTDFILDRNTVTGVRSQNLKTKEIEEFTAKTIICNIDPQQAARSIGLEKFSPTIQRKLNYDYSPSNYMAYCVVKDLDLRDYGFGKWNTFHTSEPDLNVAFDRMYRLNDFSNPSFAITTPTLLTTAERDCPEDCQIVEFLTVANYDYFKQLKATDPQAYRQKKTEIFESIIDVVEKHYIPNFRKYLVFNITGSPTTNEDYCWCPEGNSYGSSLTPKNMSIGRLNHETSLENFYFCNASSGYPGFAPTFWTGARLYQILSGDAILG
jgi:all-trans-retinol 13,14-reductase